MEAGSITGPPPKIRHLRGWTSYPYPHRLIFPRPTKIPYLIPLPGLYMYQRELGFHSLLSSLSLILPFCPTAPPPKPCLLPEPILLPRACPHLRPPTLALGPRRRPRRGRWIRRARARRPRWQHGRGSQDSGSMAAAALSRSAKRRRRRLRRVGARSGGSTAGATGGRPRDGLSRLVTSFFFFIIFYLKDWTGDQRGVTRERVLCPEFNPTHLSSNR